MSTFKELKRQAQELVAKAKANATPFRPHRLPRTLRREASKAFVEECPKEYCTRLYKSHVERLDELLEELKQTETETETEPIKKKIKQTEDELSTKENELKELRADIKRDIEYARNGMEVAREELDYVVFIRLTEEEEEEDKKEE